MSIINYTVMCINSKISIQFAAIYYLQFISTPTCHLSDIVYNSDYIASTGWMILHNEMSEDEIMV